MRAGKEILQVFGSFSGLPSVTRGERRLNTGNRKYIVPLPTELPGTAARFFYH